MSERIVFADGTVFHCPEQPKVPVHPFSDRSRGWIQVCVVGSLEEVKAKFVDKAVYFCDTDTITQDEQGNDVTETLRQDLSTYSIAGELVDTRDGNITVYMGKPTELERVQQVVDQADVLAAAASEVAQGSRSPDSLAAAVASFHAKKEEHKHKPEPAPAPKPEPKPPNAEEKKPKP